MARKEVFVCDNCGVEVDKNYRNNTFLFKDEKILDYTFDNFTLKITREIDSHNGVNTPCLCERCFLQYLESAVTQLNSYLLIKGVCKDK